MCSILEPITFLPPLWTLKCICRLWNVIWSKYIYIIYSNVALRLFKKYCSCSYIFCRWIFSLTTFSVRIKINRLDACLFSNRFRVQKGHCQRRVKHFEKEKKNEQKTTEKMRVIIHTENIKRRTQSATALQRLRERRLGATSSVADDLSNKCYTESPGVISGFRPLVERRRRFYDAWLSFIHWELSQNNVFVAFRLPGQ